MKRKAVFTGTIVGLLFVLFQLLNALFPLPVLPGFSKVVLDKNGSMVHVFLSDDDKWRLRTSLHEISPLFRKTIVFKEDKYFYYHPGINPVAVVRAAINNLALQKRTSGASTITMQVARLLVRRDRTMSTKLIEMFRSLQLEWSYSKDEILQLYLNLAPYGGNVEGVKSASLIYYNKQPTQLSLAEVVALSIIPNRPSSLNPKYGKQQLLEQRNKWLHRFRSEKLFAQQQIEDALAEPIDVGWHSLPRFAPHFSYRMKLQQNTEVRTNLDLSMQLKLEKMVREYSASMRQLNIRNAALLVVENSTQQVVAYVGSSDFSNAEDGGQVDGVRAIRQPGSTLKPLLYGLAIDKGLITPKTVLYDVPINFGGFAPENYDNLFNGAVTAEFALMNSLNVPAVKLLNDLGVPELVNTLARIGFRQVKKDRSHLGLSLILGGCGVTLEELTSLFAAFANGGVYHSLRYIAETNRMKGDTVLSPSANYIVTEILSSNSREDLPTGWQANVTTPHIAWKTGTSYGRRDAWSIGYNMKYTVGIWLGNFSGEGVPELNGANIASPLLFDVFNTIDRNRSSVWYNVPLQCQLRYVCSESGCLPNTFCDKQVIDYFLPLTSTNKICDHIKEVVVSANQQVSYCKNCQPENGYKLKRFRNINPEMKEWYDERQIRYEAIPVHNPDCTALQTTSAPRITAPINGMQYLLNEEEPEPIQLVCQVENDVHYVYWYINDKLLKRAHPTERVFFTPVAGKVKISCSDDRGRNTNNQIEVKWVKL